MKKNIILLLFFFFVTYLMVCLVDVFIINCKPRIVMCIEDNNVPFVKNYLIENGDPNVVYGAFNSRENDDHRNRSLIYIAIEKQNLEICQLLINHGADLSIIYKKQPVLFYAVNKFPIKGIHTQYQIIELLGMHCDINQLHRGENFMQYAKGLGLNELYVILSENEKFSSIGNEVE